MARIDITGISIDYEFVGDPGAPAVVLTPGAPELARLLAAAGKRVLLWDRPNCGASDISIPHPWQPD